MLLLISGRRDGVLGQRGTRNSRREYSQQAGNHQPIRLNGRHGERLIYMVYGIWYIYTAYYSSCLCITPISCGYIKYCGISRIREGEFLRNAVFSDIREVINSRISVVREMIDKWARWVSAQGVRGVKAGEV